MKYCTKCKETKPLNMFYKNRSSRDGLRSNCKKCTEETIRLYNESNPEKIKTINTISGKAWREANPEKVKARGRKWRKENSDRINAKNQRYLAKLLLLNTKISQRTLSAWSIQVRNLRSFCNWCFSEDSLEAHHVLSKNKYPQHALDINNGLTLCADCHITIHKQGGF